MKSWEKAEGDGEERQKSEIGGCLFGSVSMMDVGERKRKSRSSLWGKEGMKRLRPCRRRDKGVWRSR